MNIRVSGNLRYGAIGMVALAIVLIGCENPVQAPGTTAPATTFTVFYHGNGNTGGEAPGDSTEYVPGDSAVVAGVGGLERAEYTFSEWNEAADGSGTAYSAGDEIIMASANVHLYAQWVAQERYTVSYDANGGTGGAAPSDPGSYTEGSTVTVLDPGTLVRDGHTFVSWNTEQLGTGTALGPGSTFEIGPANVTLYAQWTADPTYTISYDSNGGTSGSAPVDGINYVEGATATILGPGTLERSGHRFDGWNTNELGTGTGYLEGETLTVGTSDITLYAVWALIPTYSVTYDENGATHGTPPVDSTAYEAGDMVTVLGAGSLSRDGHSFAGWNREPDGTGTAHTAGSTFEIGPANVQLYAVWNEIVPTFEGLTPRGEWTYEYGRPSTGYGVTSAGGYVYVAAFTGGLKIFQETSGKATPISYLPTAGNAYDVVVSGSYAYVAANTNGVLVVDISNAASPSLIHSVPLSGGTRRLALDGTTLWAIDFNGVVSSIDITSPAAAAVMDTIDVGTFGRDITIAGDIIYVAADSAGVVAVSGANPSNLTLMPTAGFVVPSETNDADSVDHDGSYLYVGDHGLGLLIVDVSTPTAPELAGRSAESFHSEIEAHGGFVYARSTGDIDVYQPTGLSTSAPPTINPLTTVDIDGGDTPQRLTIAGGTLYAVGVNYGFSSLSLAVPSAPSLVSYFNFNESIIGSHLHGSLLYVAIANSTYNRGGEIKIFDLANPDLPTQVGSLTTAETPYSFDAEGSTLYVGCNGELLVVDVSNPATPSLLGTYGGLFYQGYGVEAQGTTVFVASSGHGLRVVDASNPSAPTLLDFYDVSGIAEDVATYGDYVYVGMRSGSTTGWIDVINASDPSNLTLETTLSIPETASSIHVAEEQLFVSYDDGFSLYDLSVTPEDPGFVQSTVLSHIDPLLTYHYGHLFVADGLSGLKVFQDPAFATPELTNTDAVSTREIALDGNLAVVIDGSSDVGFRVYTTD